MFQKDEREKEQLKKTNEVIDTIQTTLNSWSSNIANLIKTEISGIVIPVPDTNSTNLKISTLEDKLNSKIDGVIQAVGGIKGAIINLKESQKEKVKPEY